MPPLVLHVWPGRWGLPSIDAGCLEAVIYLQLALPGLYSIIETADPDQSPSGLLPFLTHGQIIVSPLPSIISYISSLNHALLKPSDFQDGHEIDPSTVNPNLDAGLSPLQLSQRSAWRAYLEAQLGDLVAHSFFVLEPNFALTHATLASMLPVPQRYYVPRRIKECYRPRLEAVGLWLIGNEPEDRQQGRRTERHHNETSETKIKRAFGQAKLVEKARLVFDILVKLLSKKSFIFTDGPTSADLALASRILLLTNAPLPNSALKDLLEAFYPSLISHATRIHTLSFPSSPSTSNPRPQILPPTSMNFLTIFKSSWSHFVRRNMSRADESEEVKRFRRYRLGWFALAVTGAVGYVMTQGIPLTIVIERGDAGSTESQEMQGDEEELLDDMDEVDV